MLNLRFVEPALSYEKGATILLQPTRAKDWSDFWLDSGCLVSFCPEKNPPIIFETHQQRAKFRKYILHSHFGARKKK